MLRHQSYKGAIILPSGYRFRVTRSTILKSLACWNYTEVFRHGWPMLEFPRWCSNTVPTCDGRPRTLPCVKKYVKFSEIAWMYMKYLCICDGLMGPVISIICNLVLPIVYGLIVRLTVQNVCINYCSLQILC